MNSEVYVLLLYEIVLFTSSTSEIKSKPLYLLDVRETSFIDQDIVSYQVWGILLNYFSADQRKKIMVVSSSL